MDFELCIGLDSDKEAITELIADSARGLGSSHYSAEQIEAALRSSFGVDSQLIEDQTFYLAVHGQALVGCGGWSYRETLFGSDHETNRSAAVEDPETGAAKIRAFFVRPAYARMGVGTLILNKCELEAWRRGFRRLELMSTLPGVAFYRRHGYIPETSIYHGLNQLLKIEFVPMSKRLLRPGQVP